MEENENECENSNKTVNSISVKISSHAAVLSSDPLFSSFATLCILILLYFPSIFLKIVFSPVLVITFTILLTLLRFGATQRNKNKRNSESNCTPEPADEISWSNYSNQDHKWVKCIETSFKPSSCFEESFVEWNVRAPLEVIHEVYEGEEGEGEDQDQDQENIKDPNKRKNTGNQDPSPFSVEMYSSLSLYYPETDSDSSSDGDFSAIGDRSSPGSGCFRWEDEDREGLIEIALDYGHDGNKRNILDFENFYGEEENNLIEIDISPVKNEEKRRISANVQ